MWIKFVVLCRTVVVGRLAVAFEAGQRDVAAEAATTTKAPDVYK